jgi:hypothetical protein
MPLHHPLGPNQIRVLFLEQGISGDPLCGCLIHAEIYQTNRKNVDNTPDNPPASASITYGAISYVWGREVSPYRIHMENGELEITEPLHAALHRLRYPDRPRILWADAICIDQDDTSEKSAQVARIASIFRATEKVIMWLGDDGQVEAGWACAVSAVFTEIMPRDEEISLKSVQRGLKGMKQCRCGHDLVPVPDAAGMGLSKLSCLRSSPWFSRLWTLQELQLAHEQAVAFGPHVHERPIFTICWSVKDVCDLLAGFPRREARPRRQLPPLVTLGLADPLAHLIALNVKLECKGAKDRIFAILSILDLQDKVELKPDYAVDLGKLYRRAIRVSMAKGSREEHMDILHLFGVIGTETDAASSPVRPSWVPHFHYLTELSLCRWSERKLVADTVRPSDIHAWGLKPDELYINAKVVATITESKARGEGEQEGRIRCHARSREAAFEVRVPRSTEPGDSPAHVQGTVMAIVVRRKPDGTYRLLGEADLIEPAILGLDTPRPVDENDKNSRAGWITLF